MDLTKLISFAVEHGASDIHLQAGAAPMLRIAGKMRTIEGGVASQDDLLGFLKSIVPPGRSEAIAEAAVAGLDFAYDIPDVARFRCSVFSTTGHLGVTMRVIKGKIRSITELQLPEAILDIALSGRGLTLVTGTTGSGKSTTLAAMIDLINASRHEKIICIEDPIEYLHTNKKALITQIEVGVDSPSFDQAIRQAMRQDPDVILIGEMRDVETLRVALRAADTGHQVFSTVHSANAPQTIERIIAMFPPAEHKLLLSQLSHSLEAIISQRLLPDIEGKGRVPIVEILRGGPATEKFIMEGRLAELADYIERGESGMQSFDQHLFEAFNQNKVLGRDALAWASKPESFAIAMRGIRQVGAGKKT